MHAPGKYHPGNVPERANLTPPHAGSRAKWAKGWHEPQHHATGGGPRLPRRSSKLAAACEFISLVVLTGAACMLRDQIIPRSKFWASRPFQTVGSRHHRLWRRTPSGIGRPPSIVALPCASCTRGGTHPAVLSKKVVRYVVGHDARQVEVDPIRRRSSRRSSW